MIAEGINRVRLTEEDLRRVGLNIARVSGAARCVSLPLKIRWWHRWLKVLPCEVEIEVFEMRP